mmetsp:Transcript_45445/g.110489  ORF Transcript_45445/g.110489 Transcript_45445/m.110489 type:complete len:714 (-) Transcript_45445:1007-3148(-)
MKRKAAQLSPAASASASIVRSSAPPAVPPVATYGTDVLGKSCLVMFEMDDDDDPSKLEPFRGTVTAFEATLRLQENLEAKMAAEETAAIKSEQRSQPSRRAASAAMPKQKQKNDDKDEPRKPRTQKYRKNYNPDNWKPHVNRLHFITFDDGDERWLNLSELQAEGRLWWQDTASATTDKAEDTKPAATLAVPTMPPAVMPGMMMPNPMLAMQHQQWAVMQQQMHAQVMQRQQAAAGAASATAPTTETDAATTPAKTTTHNRDSATPSTEEAALGYNKDGSIKKRKGRKPGSRNKPKVGPDGQPIPKEAHVASKKMPRTPRTPDVPITSVPPSEPPPDTLLLGELKQGGEDPDLSWLEALRAWMMKVPHGRHAKTASKDNAAAVVRQMHKLATGEGITQAHWAVPFYQHIVVDPRVTDPATIMVDAKEFEKVHGDKSGGWKLKHPIKNFVDFCEYIKDPVAAITATAKRRATLDEAAAKRSATKASSKKKTEASPPSSTPQDGQTLEEFVEAMARKEGAGENTSVAAPGTPVAEVVTETEVLAMPEAEIVATATTSPTKPSPSTAGAAAAAASRKSSSHSKRKANRVAASYSQAYAHTQTQAAPSPITRQQPRSHSGSNDLFVADQAAAAVAQALYNSRQQIPQHHHQQTLSDHYYGQHQQQPAIDRALQNVALQSAAQQLHHQQQQQRQQQQQQQQNNLYYGRQHQNNYHASL